MIIDENSAKTATVSKELILLGRKPYGARKLMIKSTYSVPEIRGPGKNRTCNCFYKENFPLSEEDLSRMTLDSQLNLSVVILFKSCLVSSSVRIGRDESCSGLGSSER